MVTCDPTFCVVIPFYQKDEAPLVLAVQSVLNQRGVPTPQILIVDDGSPCPALPILYRHFANPEDFIRVIYQPNGGAAKARNTALNNLPQATRYVAFLDSDDEWATDHLSNAKKALDAGCDFYFANYKRLDWPQTRFEQMGPVFSYREALIPEAGIYRYSDNHVLPVLGYQMVKTSTVVYLRERLAAIRFRENLVLGEDDVFWLEAFQHAAKIGVCLNVGVQMGEGVNISQGSEWGGDRSFHLMSLNMVKWKLLPGIFNDSPEVLALTKVRKAELRRMFIAGLLHRLRRGCFIPMEAMIRFTRADKTWFFSIPSETASMFAETIRSVLKKIPKNHKSRGKA